MSALGQAFFSVVPIPKGYGNSVFGYAIRLPEKKMYIYRTLSGNYDQLFKFR